MYEWQPARSDTSFASNVLNVANPFTGIPIVAGACEVEEILRTIVSVGDRYNIRARVAVNGGAESHFNISADIDLWTRTAGAAAPNFRLSAMTDAEKAALADNVTWYGFWWQTPPGEPNHSVQCNIHGSVRTALQDPEQHAGALRRQFYTLSPETRQQIAAAENTSFTREYKRDGVQRAALWNRLPPYLRQADAVSDSRIRGALFEDYTLNT